MNHQISFIIPVFRERNIINVTIDHIHRLQDSTAAEIIVVDAESEENTISKITAQDVMKIIAPKGRGTQLNCGAREATGDILIFLHADTRLPETAINLISRIMDNENYSGGAFDLSIDSPRCVFRIIEMMASIRSRLTRIPYGDQAIFIRSGYFKSLGGFLDIPIMEDVEFMRRVKRNNGKICILKEKVITSSRRWEKEGPLYCTLRNWILVTFYFFGIRPQKLVRFYKS
jgi:rSAM/selenodomain-associated transferase 2